MTKAFHILVSLFVALPLGAGGLCCCLLGPAGDAIEMATAEPARSCCPAEPAPAESSAPCPADGGENECGCPVRDTVLLAASSGGNLLPLLAQTSDLVAPQGEDDLTYLPEELREGSRVPHPPPKEPLYRTLSVLLC